MNTEIELNRVVPGVKLTGLFFNPTADHLLIGFSTELLYLNQKFPKPKPVRKNNNILLYNYYHIYLMLWTLLNSLYNMVYFPMFIEMIFSF